MKKWVLGSHLATLGPCLLLALLLAPLTVVQTMPDSMLYYTEALKIYNGEGYDLLPRGPGFAGLLAISFHLFGPSPWSALVVTRTFFVLNVLVVYLLGSQLFNRPIAAIAATITIFSLTLHGATEKILLDAVYPFFVLFGVYATIRCYSNQSKVFAVVAGCSYGIALLTKEVALLYLPFPFLALLVSRRLRCWWALRLAIIQLAVVALVVAPWAIYVFQQTGDLSTLLGKGGPKVQTFISEGHGGILAFLLNPVIVLRSLGNYISEHVIELFTWWPLILLAWALVAWDSWRTSTSRYLLLSGLLFAPAMLVLGQISGRNGQSMIFYSLSIVAVAFLLWRGSHWLATVIQSRNRPGPRPRKTGIALCAFFFIGVVATELFADKVPMAGRIANRSLVYQLATGNEFEFQLSGQYSSQAAEVAQWIRENVPEGSSLLVGYSLVRSLPIITADKYRIAMIPFESLNISLMPDGAAFKASNRKARGKTLFLWVRRRNDQFDNILARMRLLDEGNLWRIIGRESAEYIVMDKRNWFFREYFLRHPGLTHRQTFKKGIEIYQVTGTGPLENFPTHIGEDVPKALEELRVRAPKSYRAIVEDLMPRRTTIPKGALEFVMDGKAKLADIVLIPRNFQRKPLRPLP